MEMLISLSPLLIMVVIFYFLLIRPQQKKQKQVRQMQSELKKGDKIVTIGGFHGTVHALDEDKIVLITDGGTKLTYDRSAVRDVTEQL
ncbi:preprotein translocase subunit YajC [Gracilibacillus ureilyticus]|uniref:Preprotein translocase subunit YajC n=1 Tax=Gracilibacillus ureilyticus TaxID=531814 RepID=A0A1H9RN75_9BACI|nr:preprotein translocase subunit YajC [Gracilibacillus ureilyticus]SER73978.1 preprotein translocase subunit YajC [Gracilibacillus ureilyticus]